MSLVEENTILKTQIDLSELLAHPGRRWKIEELV